MSYYEIIFGSGLAWCNRYVVKTEYPTTNDGALVDALIDYLVEQKANCILDMDKYAWGEDDETLYEKDNPEWIIYPDEYVQGGNCGDVLWHHGEFRMGEIKESEIRDAEIVEVD